MKALGGVGVLAILLIALARQLDLNNVSVCRAQSKSRHTALCACRGGRSDSDCCQINVSKHGTLFYVAQCGKTWFVLATGEHPECVFSVPAAALCPACQIRFRKVLVYLQAGRPLAPRGNVLSGLIPSQHLAGISRNDPRAVEETYGNRSQRSVAHYRPSGVQEKPDYRAATNGFLRYPLGWICC